jgi:hypothetical protein
MWKQSIQETESKERQWKVYILDSLNENLLSCYRSVSVSRIVKYRILQFENGEVLGAIKINVRQDDYEDRRWL